MYVCNSYEILDNRSKINEHNKKFRNYSGVNQFYLIYLKGSRVLKFVYVSVLGFRIDTINRVHKQ